MKRILLIGGSDSSGGAGVEADQKVVASHACYAMTATAALTAQNTQGVYDIHETPSTFVEKQIDACVEDIGVDVLKTGMLASAETVSVVANAIRKHKITTTVIDPVMVATSGAQLLPESAVNTLCSELLPVTTVLTPNIPEANLMLKKAGKDAIDVQNLDGLKSLAAAVHGLGPKNVLLKGGHLPLSSDYKVAKSEDEKQVVCNVLFAGDSIDVIEFPHQKSENTHGTGCSLASALACNLALGHDLVQSVIAASRYVDAGIKSAVKLGRGSGPINHFHSLQVLPFAPGGFVDYLLDRKDVQPAWYDFTHHEFVEQMGAGTLDPDAFKYYMIQDYLYLIHFARANALAGYKAKNMDDIAGAATIVTHIKNETELHINECKEFGLTVEMMEKYEESQACTAYTRYVLDIGQSEDWLALQISLLPCLLGYGMIARRLKKMQETNPPETPNRYLTWINNYVAEDYTAAVKKGCELIEKHAFKQSPYRIEELVKIFIHATKMETGFWEMASAPEPRKQEKRESETRKTHHNHIRW
ncbi:putative hydroxymethylpyrimidine/phosphomethylpyrimidine kinase 2 [Pseudocercospora fuligena]|uniref:Putative hydroxymethylpyrimidine/phosphomethylpyrimidine kinase 2 n=1 Tax=Pseudocercospora fuligena TaxID=685502 RepID=A0A8H6RLM6_9PEZI|nr:putative hydroxymethylpyrimidine/phosphomethylpyrimidine kinase 2 [Pseudocercospora fuligena]